MNSVCSPRSEPKFVFLQQCHSIALICQRHVNYRDSKLTRILKPSLCGNARIAIVCCVSLSDKYVEETRSTLQFATRAKLVKTNAIRHVYAEDADLISTMQLEIARARWENRKLDDWL
jgi:centromeric protein E